MPITTQVESSNPAHGKVYSMQFYVINLSVTCNRSVVFSWYSIFVHQQNLNRNLHLNYMTSKFDVVKWGWRKSGVGLGLWCLMPLSKYFSYIVAVSFIGGGNQRKHQPVLATDKLYHIMLFCLSGIQTTNCISSCKSNYHTVTTTTASKKRGGITRVHCSNINLLETFTELFKVHPYFLWFIRITI
jgi:hypothetical protein